MKTRENDANVIDFINSVKNDKRRQDAFAVLELMEKVTGKKAKMWGPSIIGFDKHTYLYASGKSGEICAVGFSPRVQALTFYVSTGFENSDQLLKQLGKHKMGKGCLYVNKLEDIKIAVLEQIIWNGYQRIKNKT